MKSFQPADSAGGHAVEAEVCLCIKNNKRSSSRDVNEDESDPKRLALRDETAPSHYGRTSVGKKSEYIPYAIGKPISE